MRRNYRNFGGEPFVENNEEFYQWSNKSENDIYLQGNSYRYQMNNSSTEWNNATGQYGEHRGYMNAGGDPSINVGGETFNMQPTLAWNQGDFFGQPQGFGSSPTACAPCPQGFQGDRQSCGGTGCYNSLGQLMYESGTGIPQGMGVQYTQI